MPKSEIAGLQGMRVLNFRSLYQNVLQIVSPIYIPTTNI